MKPKEQRMSLSNNLSNRGLFMVFFILFISTIGLYLIALLSPSTVQIFGPPVLTGGPNFARQVDDEKEEIGDKQQVLLLTYGRSGSTFSSAIISFPQYVFYYFEPLHFLGGAQRTKDELSEKCLRVALSCDYTRHGNTDEVIRFLGNAFYHASPSTKEFYSCRNDKALSGLAHVKCFIKFVQDCRKHRVTFAKTIRLRMKVAQGLIEENPNLQLLYLIRDPRAVLSSQALVFGRFSLTKDIESVAKRQCTTLQEDVAIFQNLTRLFPGRVKAIRYEDGAMDPIAYTESIYSFLRYPITPEVVDYVKFLMSLNSTSAQGSKDGKPEMPKDCAYCIRRSNPQVPINKWRGKMEFEQAKIIDAACGHLYELLGYRDVKNEKDFKDTENYATFVKPSKGGIFD